MTAELPDPSTSATPRPGEAAGSPGISAEHPGEIVRVRVTAANPDGDDATSVASAHPGVHAARWEAGVLVAEVGPPADRATLAAFLADAGFGIGDG
ncbi:MAG TPA: hypothetical protein VGN54_09835 [Mycobacteriales bacterium]|nr:hypothetical protein [Mycobacteriales bacterium]